VSYDPPPPQGGPSGPPPGRPPRPRPGPPPPAPGEVVRTSPGGGDEASARPPTPPRGQPRPVDPRHAGAHRADAPRHADPFTPGPAERLPPRRHAPSEHPYPGPSDRAPAGPFDRDHPGPLDRGHSGSLDQGRSGSLDHGQPDLLDRAHAGPPDRRTAGPPDRGYPGAPDRGYAEPPVRGSVGRPGPDTGPRGFHRPDPGARAADPSAPDRRPNGEPDRGFRGEARLDPEPSPEATRYTSAFSGSLPPPPPPRIAPPRRIPPRPRPPDPPTEVIEPVADDHAEDYAGNYAEDGYHDDAEDDAAGSARKGARNGAADDHGDSPPPPPEGGARKAVRAVGELLITAGLVVLLFVVYEVYVTDLISAGKQDDATQALDEQWGANTVQGAEPQREARYDLVEGQAFAKMYIPVFGPDYKFSIVEGTTDKHLEIGPGHYVNTALPGDPGNFSVAGHRVGKGAPFNDLDLMDSCDAIVVETQTQWFVYRMLPKAGEVAGWAQNPKARDPRCAKVAPLGGSYAKTVGQEIVLPSQGEVINPIPHVTGAGPEAQQASLMTLTTCHPRFSDKQRLIVHAVLAQGYPKAPGFVPEELKEQ